MTTPSALGARRRWLARHASMAVALAALLGGCDSSGCLTYDPAARRWTVAPLGTSLCPGTAAPDCRCEGNVPEGAVNLACGEATCLGGVGYRCVSARVWTDPAACAADAQVPGVDGGAGVTCAPYVACGDVCVDVRSDANNCGTCGARCQVDETCTAGVCQRTRCPSEQYLCGGECIPQSRTSCGCSGSVCAFGDNPALGCDDGECYDLCTEFHSDCLRCLLDDRCGWCLTTGRCVSKYQSLVGSAENRSDSGDCGGSNFVPYYSERDRCPG
jgi:hypothetical protein